MEMISVGSSSCSYTSPTWAPGIITIILILQETETLGGHKPSSKLHSGGWRLQPCPLALYLQCP